MATAPVKSPLHNFPKKLLQWNVKDTDSADTHFTTTSPPREPPSASLLPPPPASSIPVGSRSVRPRRPPSEDRDPVPEPPPEEFEKHWNLRPRRAAAVKTIGPNNGGGGGDAVGGTAGEKTTKLKDGQASNGGGGSAVGNEKKKFWIALSREEIDEDIYSITGSKPSRRPKRRPKNVQKQLDNVFPGLWLVGLSPDSYRTFDSPPKK